MKIHTDTLKQCFIHKQCTIYNHIPDARIFMLMIQCSCSCHLTRSDSKTEAETALSALGGTRQSTDIHRVRSLNAHAHATLRMGTQIWRQRLRSARKVALSIDVKRIQYDDLLCSF